ncbi:MAG: HAD family phosphatase [Candidatus Chisholmbacteria bacterium]|nr:HAD family phosphatase [Candidatus Chisholmbacteria bacterium]
MKYKAIMMDVDRTLCPQGDMEKAGNPSPKVLAALKKAKKLIRIGVATSRPIYKTRHILETINANGYSIFLGGPQIAHSRTLKTVWLKPISKPAKEKIYTVAKKYKLVALANDGFCIPAFQFSRQALSAKLINIFFHHVPFSQFENILKDLSSINDVAVTRLVTENKQMTEFDITDIKATKHHAMVHVAKLLKIKPQEIIGVGDGYNDYPLLMACGLKIAMGNAVPELKAIADFVAPSVDEDGVATVIEKFILNQ